MSASVAGEDGLVAVERELPGELRMLEKSLQLFFHLAAIARDQVVLAGGEEIFAVIPGRTDERDAAGEGFEDADGGDAGERLDVGTAWDVHGRFETGKGFGR